MGNNYMFINMGLGKYIMVDLYKGIVYSCIGNEVFYGLI